MKRLKDPTWQVAFPYRDNKIRRREKNRSLDIARTYFSNHKGIQKFYFRQILDFGFLKDGLTLMLDKVQIDKDLVRQLKLELDLILDQKDILLAKVNKDIEDAIEIVLGILRYAGWPDDHLKEERIHIIEKIYPERVKWENGRIKHSDFKRNGCNWIIDGKRCGNKSIHIMVHTPNDCYAECQKCAHPLKIEFRK